MGETAALRNDQLESDDASLAFASWRRDQHAQRNIRTRADPREVRLGRDLEGGGTDDSIMRDLIADAARVRWLCRRQFLGGEDAPGREEIFGLKVGRFFRRPAFGGQAALRRHPAPVAFRNVPARLGHGDHAGRHRRCRPSARRRRSGDRAGAPDPRRRCRLLPGWRRCDRRRLPRGRHQVDRRGDPAGAHRDQAVERPRHAPA